jgi:hypothetical protein
VCRRPACCVERYPLGYACDSCATASDAEMRRRIRRFSQELQAMADLLQKLSTTEIRRQTASTGATGTIH